MKERKILKIAGLVIAVALMICGVIGISASATETTLEIDSANVAYNDMMHLAFTLTGTDTLPDGADAGIIIWKGEQTEYTVQNASYKTFDENVDGETTYYKSAGIPATDIGTVYYLAACYSLDGTVTVTETPFKYSIATYLAKRLTETVTANQAALYCNVLKYGAASDTVLNDSAYTLVHTVGGSAGGWGHPWALCEDEGVIIRAQAINEDGEYFVKWVDAAGATVSEERVTSVSPTATGIVTYTAVYGTVDESPYAYAFNFEELEMGEINAGSPDLSAAPTLACYGGYSGSTMKRWQVEYSSITGMKITHSVLPAYTAYDADTKTYTLTQDESGNYLVGVKDTFSVVENYYGDKGVQAVRGQKAAGYTIGFNNFSSDITECSYAEIDLSCADMTGTGVQFHVNVTVKDGTNESSFRSNLYTSSDKTGFIYAEDSDATPTDTNKLKDSEGNVVTYSVKPGETLTLGVKLVLKTEGEATVPYIQYYINGEYVGELTCETFKAYKSAMDFSSAYVSYLSFNAITAAHNTVTVDNVCFK